jgi:hypothetical protein
MTVPEAPLEKKEASVRNVNDNKNEEEEKTQESDVDAEVDIEGPAPSSPASSEPKPSAPPEDLDDEPKKKEDPIDPPSTEASTSPPPPTLQDIQRDFKAAETNTTSPVIQQPAAAQQEETATRATRKWVLFGFAILILVAIAMLGVVISLLRDDSDGDNNNNDGSSSDPPSFRQSVLPSFVPTSSPSSAPTPNVFQSIANAPGALQLNSVSNCDECDESILPRLAFSLRGDNRNNQVTGITISSNGYLNLECSEQPFGFTNTCAMISAAGGDLDPSAGGSVWMMERFTTTSTSSATKQMTAPDSMVISWEGVQLYGDPQSFINAQITLFADETGTIEICWGEAVLNGRRFSSGVREYDPNSFYPAQGPEFDSSGISYGMWPSNRCQRFFDNKSTDSPRPVSTSSPQPIGWPTPFPSGTYAPVGPIDGFTLIAGIRGATRLDTISDCYRCEENAELPFALYWLDRYRTASMSISSSGGILLDNCRGEEYGSCFYVDVALADLNPALDNGASIWTYDGYSGSPNGDGPFIVSWENIPFDGNSNSYIQAQAHFYSNGNIDLCWGDAGGIDGRWITAAVGDRYTRTHFPATVYPFDEGQTRTGTWYVFARDR